MVIYVLFFFGCNSEVFQILTIIEKQTVEVAIYLHANKNVVSFHYLIKFLPLLSNWDRKEGICSLCQLLSLMQCAHFLVFKSHFKF